MLRGIMQVRNLRESALTTPGFRGVNRGLNEESAKDSFPVWCPRYGLDAYNQLRLVRFQCSLQESPDRRLNFRQVNLRCGIWVVGL